MDVLLPLAWLLIFPLVAIALVVLFFKSLKQQEKKMSDMITYASQRGYQYAMKPDAVFYFGSYKNGTVTDMLSGALVKSSNQFEIFHQVEPRGRDTVFSRTIASVGIPDTKLQLIVNSKINQDEKSGGYLAQYRSNQRYEAEGNFATYFDIFMPRGTAEEALALLAPDTLSFILDNMADYDIEIINDRLYVYFYDIMWADKMDGFIAAIDSLVTEMVLRPTDSRRTVASPAPVARTAAGIIDTRSLRPSHAAIVAAVLIAIGAVSIAFYSFSPWLILFPIFISIPVMLYSQGKINNEASLRRKYNKLKVTEKDSTNHNELPQ